MPAQTKLRELFLKQSAIRRIAIVSCCILFHAAVASLLASRFIDFAEQQTGEPPDAARHIELAEEQKSGHFTYIPHFWSRPLIYHLTAIYAFPPNTRQLVYYQLLNSLATGIVVLAILRILDRYVIPLSKQQKHIIWLFYYFSPGLFFLSATMRSEFFSFFALWTTIYAIFAAKPSHRLAAVSLASCAGLLSRPTGVLFAWLAWFCRRLSIGATLALVLLICSALLSITALMVPGFLQGPHYYFTEYEDRLRNAVNISSLDQLWRMPLKLAVSLLLDAFSFKAWHEMFQNPEILNNIAATLRIFLFGIIVASLLWGKRDRRVTRLLALYLSYVAPLILLSGFYQTRYFIPADLMLVVAAVHLVGAKNTVTYCSRTAQP